MLIFVYNLNFSIVNGVDNENNHDDDINKLKTPESSSIIHM